VPVDTIAFGTPEGTIEGELGETEPVPVAPEPLAEIASTTGGTAFEAESLGELSSAYADIGGVVAHDEVDRDVSGWFVGGGILLLAVAGTLSLAWSQRLP
jgi:Ca-activated chloride channel homolog